MGCSRRRPGTRGQQPATRQAGVGAGRDLAVVGGGRGGGDIRDHVRASCARAPHTPCWPQSLTVDGAEVTATTPAHSGRWCPPPRWDGRIVQDGNTDEMGYGVGETLAHLSHTVTSCPGDLLATGTTAGVGYARRPPWLSQPGDVVEVDVERLGPLRSTVVAVRPARPPRADAVPRRAEDRSRSGRAGTTARESGSRVPGGPGAMTGMGPVSEHPPRAL
ncbi:fumarylacetoacetate hydrolase family protein [Streptomyces tendae]|uniref:fumarylacetoacetate hydrolase family protein n=1 Tax=Streptomyces tendae TaxID=1932 RepID=UPI0036946574